jgi:Holliday junction resolvase-like predicted endonuclease
LCCHAILLVVLLIAVKVPLSGEPIGGAWRRSYSAAPYVQVQHLGNVDLLLTFPNGRRCPVEIKSWRSTRYLRRFNAALRQVRRQRETLLAQNAVLWLPEAKIRNAGYRHDIVVVQGDEHYLIECLRKLKYRYVIRFPEPAPLALREQLWKIPLKWKPNAKQWATPCVISTRACCRRPPGTATRARPNSMIGEATIRRRRHHFLRHTRLHRNTSCHSLLPTN